MYIGSTNLYLNLPEYDTKAPASWITSEKYDNCENFYQHLVVKQTKHRLFHKKNDSMRID
ncbi:hypothetical protein SAMN02745136_00728 [Anaerocolumna jejuensis DSM 15929]|jgi:hypothetical protein|uniref:Uncharacterized protein n=1 Tax=Anaerocolumna jejuensis DSM 15929 TaxID=1121322 RepID=A0A1M6LV44_9FIRM|nr:hypothetical protein [Anaerocolumna jejuensis]SHJ75046.1 hypothetical protein SAMN02745136_00728 [Anaerocolumna jejuensis DSM 15929]